jgi:DNA modification methylase
VSVKILEGHCITVLRTLAAESVHCIWTSVPYFGLRSYQTVPQVWGGDEACEHVFAERTIDAEIGRGNWTQGTNGRGEVQPGGVDVAREPIRTKSAQGFCQRCGAWRGEHGLEPSLRMWVENEVAIWRELRRVLRKDGVVWLNVGDAYASNGGASGAQTLPDYKGHDQRPEVANPGFKRWEKDYAGLKPKQRLMMPARLALALQDDGWFLRDEIIWQKPNPMPSSVEDRTTPAHEMLYMLTRSARYFYDQTAIREPFADSSIVRLSQKSIDSQEGGPKQDAFDIAGLNDRAGSRRPNEIVQGLSQKIKRKPAGWDTADGSHSTIRHTTGRSGNKERKLGVDRGRPDSHMGGSVPWEGNMRNRRSVWTIATEPFPGSHFATAPTALVEPCIKAGTSERGCCPACGAPWKRDIEKEFVPQDDVSEERGVRGADGQKPMDESNQWEGFPRGTTSSETLGWSPTCKCPAHDPVPCTVLDPFLGSGTTALVADRLGRNCIGIELNSEYAKLARYRIVDNAPLLVEIS